MSQETVLISRFTDSNPYPKMCEKYKGIGTKLFMKAISGDARSNERHHGV
jgi:hypothetical protein